MKELAFGDGAVLIDEEFGVVALLKRELGYAVVGEGIVVVGYGNRFGTIVHRACACVG